MPKKANAIGESIYIYIKMVASEGNSARPAWILVDIGSVRVCERECEFCTCKRERQVRLFRLVWADYILVCICVRE